MRAARRGAGRLFRDRLSLLAVAALVAALAASSAGGGRVDGRNGPGPAGVLLIADLRGHELVVLDLKRPHEPRRIALPGGPHELLRLDDGRVVASLEQRGALAIVDLRAGAVETLELGGLPHGLAVHDGVLYVTDRSAGVVRRLRVAGWRELAPLAAGIWPHAVATLPDGEPVVASAGDDMLRIGERALTVSAMPETVALAPDGGRVAVAGARGGELEVFTADGAALLTVELGGRPVRLAFAPDGAVLAVALSAGRAVALIDAAGTVTRVPVPGVPDGLSFDASGRYLFASDLAGGVVSVIDVARGRVSAQFPSGESAGALLALAY